MQKIIHIIARDKFTSGYINFMTKQFPQYDHCFLTWTLGFTLDVYDGTKLEFIDYENIINNTRIISLLTNANMIIISWVDKILCTILTLLSSNIIHKCYLHFWGGDFYDIRTFYARFAIHLPLFIPKSYLKRLYFSKKIPIFAKEILMRYSQGYCFRHCKALVFLIAGEYEKFRAITHIKHKYYIAPMPCDTKTKIKLELYRKLEENKDNSYKILIGNSADKSNNHISAFKALSHYAQENITIYCPLSYAGEADYIKKVVDIGQATFGKHFIPLLDFINKEDYIKLLATINIGVFFNDRQQAMGNIALLLGLGAKVYMYKNTSMFMSYTQSGYNIYDAASIAKSTFSNFVEFNVTARKNNCNISDSYDEITQATKKWQIVYAQKAN